MIIGSNRNAEIVAGEFLLLNNKMTSASDLKGKEIDLVGLVK